MRVTKEFETNVCVGSSLKKIESLFLCGDLNIEEGD